MNIHELEKRLVEEGCNPGNYAIGSRGSASDTYCLTYNGQEWQVYYTERGQDQAPEYTSKSEEESVRVFLSLHHEVPPRPLCGILSLGNQGK